ncbi:hypothetical protein ASPACDRAFT_1859095 [Aspergillus aculeatus ATCC 16872]|uniref:Uncharacterized protein n=1 Tax=Aspergillus aculeatus (strain ATCC 16872 / CBS 172.66 / WB 5094) TaxID=690307 RepID=A0A1L9WJS5_ASPA1|nr:uncharacterized protein ASPACDRAFT_1859095 [Aspergillus aculeatus ATCC 16872]OJJ96402.1 hypothetical protein ASPACDRAFT_1859095 [Aspergillus aculeatus ATCC 16872]
MQYTFRSEAGVPSWHLQTLASSLKAMQKRPKRQALNGTRSTSYTDNVFKAVRSIRRFPAWSRPYAQWFLSDCAKIRRQVKRAKDIIEPLIAKRIEEILVQKGLAEMPNDAIIWMHEVATGKGKECHGAHIQLSLSMASKTSLYRMKLADSVMKETRRLKPLGVLPSHRHVSDDVVLPDGTLIPKGAIVATNMSRM